MTLQEVKEMIVQLLISSEPERSKKISTFQQLIWKDKSIDFEEDLYEILHNLAVDLNYYVPNPEWRKEDSSYYDEQGLITNIEEALQAIELLEIKNQNEQKDKD